MDYYIQGNEKRAAEIKAAFEAKGIYTASNSVGYDHYLYYSYNGLLYFEGFSNTLLNVFKSHPGYKELELPVKPMFKVGDWLWHKTKGVFPLIVEDYDEKEGYLMKYHDSKFYFGRKTIENEYRLWTIADAKDGDVLAADECYVIFKEVDGLNIKCYCTYHYMGFNPRFYIDTLQNKTAFRPATQEQCDLLFKKMEEAGYEWDAEKKELHKIKPHYDISNFKPFDKVLVRDRNNELWRIAFYGYYNEEANYTRFVGTCWSKQCIPFNDDTKHLLGTTDMCDECYINW